MHTSSHMGEGTKLAFQSSYQLQKDEKTSFYVLECQFGELIYSDWIKTLFVIHYINYIDQEKLEPTSFKKIMLLP